MHLVFFSNFVKQNHVCFKVEKKSLIHKCIAVSCFIPKTLGFFFFAFCVVINGKFNAFYLTGSSVGYSKFQPSNNLDSSYLCAVPSNSTVTSITCNNFESFTRNESWIVLLDIQQLYTQHNNSYKETFRNQFYLESVVDSFHNKAHYLLILM